MNTIDRYFLKEILMTFFVILICFFALFVLIDYTSRSSGLHLKQGEWVAYYFYLFIRRIEVLAPFTLLISVIRILCHANARYELAALMACGIPLNKSLRILITIGVSCTLLLYFNTQFIYPSSLRSIRQIEDTYAVKMSRQQQLPIIQSLLLTDGSRLLYRDYDTSQGRFMDVYWVRSLDDIYRMKWLSPLTAPPTGHLVEHLERDPQGRLLLVESKNSQTMPLLSFDQVALNEALTPPSDRSLVSLWFNLPSHEGLFTPEQAQGQAAFYRKMAMPWLGLLVCIGPAPFCSRFRRPVPVFLLYCGGLIGIILIYLWLSTASILAQNQILSPLWSLVLPFSLLMAAAFWRWSRLR